VPTLVTGAAGFVASHLLDRLAAIGDPIICWSRPNGHAPGWTAPAGFERTSVTWHAVDLLDRDGVDRAVAAAAPTRVYHLAGATHQGKSWKVSTDALRVNALGTHHLLGAIAQAVPRARVLVTGTGFVYKPSEAALAEGALLGPTSPYGFSKLAQELVARHTAETTTLEIIVCRPFNHLGPGQSADYFASSFARQIIAIGRGAPPILRVGNLDARRDLTDVRDVVAAYVELMDAGARGIYNVCSGSAHRIRDVLDRMIALAGVAVDVQVAPELLRPVDQPLLLGCADKLARDTGWQPRIPIDQTLADVLADWERRRAGGPDSDA
jgi:GDP-4-dehydro-6-deoxy-D-mannose reductase